MRQHDQPRDEETKRIRRERVESLRTLYVEFGPDRLADAILKKYEHPDYPVPQRLLDALRVTDLRTDMKREKKSHAAPRNKEAIRAGVTPKEMVVLSLIAEGYEEAKAAKELGMSTWTVKAHTRSLRKKLNVHTAAHLVHRAWQLGILPITS